MAKKDRQLDPNEHQAVQHALGLAIDEISHIPEAFPHKHSTFANAYDKTSGHTRAERQAVRAAADNALAMHDVSPEILDDVGVKRHHLLSAMKKLK